MGRDELVPRVVGRGGEAGRGVVGVDGDADEQERDEGDDDVTPGPVHLDPPQPAPVELSPSGRRAGRLSARSSRVDMGRTPGPARLFVPTPLTGPWVRAETGHP